MILIAHRANLNGPNYATANTPEQIDKVLAKGFNCEVDVWKVFDNFFLGHDEPRHKVSRKFLKNKNLWCHAKNLAALEDMLYNNIHCFWHEADKFTVTSKGHIWTFPGEQVGENSVIVHKNKDWYNKYECYAVCTDYIEI